MVRSLRQTPEIAVASHADVIKVKSGFIKARDLILDMMRVYAETMDISDDEVDILFDVADKIEEELKSVK